MNPIVLGYVRLVRIGLKALDDVPEKYRAEVDAALQ